MKMFNDSHLEVKKFFKGTFFTHPYEAGWADEAIFFVMVEKIEGDPVFKGLGQHIIKVNSNFGNYIRLAVSIEGGEMFLNLHIACKG